MGFAYKSIALQVIWHFCVQSAANLQRLSRDSAHSATAQVAFMVADPLTGTISQQCGMVA
jgi:hypothetical protein